VGCYIWFSDEGTGRVRTRPRCTKCNSTLINSTLINGQCTNHRIGVWWSVAVRFWCGDYRVNILRFVLLPVSWATLLRWPRIRHGDLVTLTFDLRTIKYYRNLLWASCYLLTYSLSAIDGWQHKGAMSTFWRHWCRLIARAFSHLWTKLWNFNSLQKRRKMKPFIKLESLNGCAKALCPFHSSTKVLCPSVDLIPTPTLLCSRNYPQGGGGILYNSSISRKWCGKAQTPTPSINRNTSSG